MKKKFLAVLLAGVLTVGIPQMAFATGTETADSDTAVETGLKTSTDGLWDIYVNSDNTATVEKYNGTDVDVVIPAEIDGHKIVELGFYAFAELPPDGKGDAEALNNTIKSITIPDSLTVFRTEQNCFALEKIIVGDDNPNFKSVDGVLFDKEQTKIIFYPPAKSDTKYDIPDGVQSITGAFNDCVNLTSISIPASVSDIDNRGAFSNCPALKEINVDETNKNYSSDKGILFNNDKTTIVRYPSAKEDVSYEVPNGVITICQQAFDECKSLESVTVPSSVETMDFVFYTHTYLKEINVDAENKNYFSRDGVLFQWWYDDNIVLLHYPPQKAGTTYTIPDDVRSLSAGAFSYCDNLTSIEIPASVRSMQSGTFWNCGNISIKYEGTKEQWSDISYGKSFTTETLDLKEVTVTCTDGTINGKTEPEDKPSSGSSSSSSSSSTTTPEPTEYTDGENETGVTASADEGVLPDGAELVVTPVTSETSDSKFTYDISFKDTDGKEVQPKGEVTVKVPVPEKFKDAEKVYVYRAETDGTYTDMKAEVKDGFVVFTTNHFSKYLVTTEEIKAETPAPETPKPTDTTPADTTTNPNTGVAVALIPAILAGAVVIVSAKKRK